MVETIFKGKKEMESKTFYSVKCEIKALNVIPTQNLSSKLFSKKICCLSFTLFNR